ncbi:MAG TPA: acyl-CoA thioesterase [Herpetosiphonaceae bacterium]
MNLFFRLLYTTLAARFRPARAIADTCRTPFRVWPTDLDVIRHMNNGIYFSILDLARVDAMIRVGLLAKLKERDWYPVVAGETIQFRKSLTLFERFEVATTVLGWDEKSFWLEQRFERKGAPVATAVIRSRFLKRSGGSVRPAEVLELIGHGAESPTLPPWVERWTNDQQSALAAR